MTIPLMPMEEEFLLESNKIEGIVRALRDPERLAFKLFVEGKGVVTVEELQRLVSVFQVGGVLRDRVGLDVSVGGYAPPKGGPGVVRKLGLILDAANDGRLDAYDTHVEYELLHPFTDGNGRSGRMLWWRMMKRGSVRDVAMLQLGFLHAFYYQTLGKMR